MTTTTRRYSAEEKKNLVREWKRSGLRQEIYAAQHGISPRTLRSWARTYVPKAVPIEQVRRMIAEAQSALEGIQVAIQLATEIQIVVDIPCRDADGSIGCATGVGVSKSKAKFSWD